MLIGGEGAELDCQGIVAWGRLMLSEHEVMSLLLSLAITESIKTPFMTVSSKSVRQKIAAVFPVNQRRQIQGLRARILVGDPASEGILANYRDPAKRVVRDLTTSFFGTKQLGIKYTSESGEITERVVEPQYILLNWPVWYLLGWDHLRDSPRMFRVDRISRTHSLSVRFRLRSGRTLLAEFNSYFNKL